MEDQVFIQHRFTLIKDGLTLVDAIVLPQADYEKLMSTDISSIKEERFDNFKELLTNPPKEEEVPLEIQLQVVSDQIDDLTSQLDALTLQQQTLQEQVGDVVEEVK